MKPPAPPMPPGLPTPGPPTPGSPSLGPQLPGPGRAAGKPPGQGGQSGPWPAPIPGGRYGLPVGSVIAFAGNILGVGDGKPEQWTDLGHYNWLPCDGGALLIAEYPQLFDAIGFTYGKKDEHNFLLPDYSGYFLRAVDLGGELDKERDDRTSTQWGTKGGVGSTQDFALQDHKHYLAQKPDMTFPIGNDGVQPAQVPGGPQASDTGQVDPEGDKVKVSQYETRSVNIYVYWLIKSRPDPWPGYVQMPAPAGADTPPEGKG